MPNLVESVKEMLKRGMSEAEIKQNLQELGVDDADSIYSQAMSAQATASTPTDVSVATPSVSKLAETMSVDTSAMEEKLADLEAQVKALNEIMQKILDTDRQILLRLKGEE